MKLYFLQRKLHRQRSLKNKTKHQDYDEDCRVYETDLGTRENGVRVIEKYTSILKSDTFINSSEYVG